MPTAVLGDWGDPDTKVLPAIWNGIDTNVFDVDFMSPKTTYSDVCKAMSNEKDLLIFAGHGCGSGMFNPSRTAGYLDGDSYLIDSTNKNLIKAKRFVGIWCHASDFAKSYNVPGFFSSMFISNRGEAAMNGITGVSSEQITKDEIKFCEDLNRLISQNVPMEEWKDILISLADMNDPVVKFNYEGLYLSK